MSVSIVKNAQKEQKLIQRPNGAAIDDVFTSKDSEGMISCGIFTMSKADAPCTITYKYAEAKIILEGTMTLKDVNADTTIVAEAGDVLMIEKGAVIAFTTESFGKAFYAAQRDYRKF